MSKLWNVTYEMGNSIENRLKFKSVGVREVNVSGIEEDRRLYYLSVMALTWVRSTSESLSGAI